MALGRVLVADADPRQRRITATLLRLAGYEASETGKGLNVLIDGRSRAFDLVVLDTRLLDGDGVDLARALRQQPETRELPILVLSADLGRMAEVESAVGPGGFMARPAKPSELAARTATLLGIEPAQRPAPA